jgi:hypothetical protein
MTMNGLKIWRIFETIWHPFFGVKGVPLDYVTKTEAMVPAAADDPGDGYPHSIMTGALFGTSCPTFADSMNARFTASLCRRPRMDGNTMPCCLIIFLGQIIWVKWQVMLRSI